MTQDEYVESVLRKYDVDQSAAQDAAERISPTIRSWAGERLASLEYSGSFEKGTANNISTDVDMFISLKSSTSETLRDIYESLFTCTQNQGWASAKQNVSIGMNFSRMKIDLVPGKIQAGYRNVYNSRLR